MTRLRLIVRALGYYWRTNLAVVAGVATAVAVLSGALLVGDSVRGSLRDLVAARLGRTQLTVTSASFFREALAADLGATPLIAMPGVVTEQATGRRASGVQVYGVDDRFWRFHSVAVSGPLDRDALVSEALANEIGASADRTILVRVERPSAIPIESLNGRKDDPGRTLRLTVRKVLDRGHMGEFSMRPQQGDVLAVFVPLSRLQQDLGQVRRVNALLTSGSTDRAQLTSLLRAHATLDDFGLRVRAFEAQNELAVDSESGFIDQSRSEAIRHAAVASDTIAHPVFSYLANTIRHGDREVPYSIVTALDLTLLGVNQPWLYEPDKRNAGQPPPIRLNDWVARELDAKPGDRVSLDYYVWRDTGELETATREFTVQAVVALSGPAADRDFVPDYPGITTAQSLSDWDPPFPIDLKRVRPVDEKYWKAYRTTPKAFIPFELGQKVWGSRYGDRTSVRLVPIGQTVASASDRFQSALRSALDPLASGFVVRDARTEGLAASNGSTDFGAYFVYFSFFLVVSALVLAALFFRLGVEQRAREVGLLRAVGFSTAGVRRLFLAEGIALASIGGLVGIAGAVAYGALMMAGLRTWWSGAVGTTSLTLHVSPTSLVAGAAGAIASAVICVWWTLRGFARLSERELLAGEIRPPQSPKTSSGRAFLLAAIVFVVIAAGLVAAAAAKAIDPAGAFFGAGSAMLIACLLALTWWLRNRVPAGLRGDLAVARLGARNTSERPGRSVLAVAVIASATFVLIAVDAFRLGAVDPLDRRSGTGGFPLLVDLQLPLVHNPDSPDGRETLGLPQGGDLSIEPFRVLPGEDTSCLNLYQPTRPRILGVGDRLIKAGRFSFQSVRADDAPADDAARANPWLLLARPLPGGAIPAIADANSLTYILHKSVGDEIVLQHGDAPVHLRIVAALSDSIFQGELLISDAHFRARFPEQQGFRFLLVDAPAARATEIANTIERTAADLGADAVPTAQRLAAFHTVENTYLSTFQTLGGLGLLVGTIGLAAVLLRNVLERRKEIALLRAVGYRASDVFTVVFAENVMLLVWGLAAGALSASIAVVPAAMERGARLPLTTGGALLVAAVLVAGLLSSAIATYIAVRMPLVGALRSE
jgi:ABC-type lipoprotein release transport system permease subunit